jgi:hypothetical protein
VRLVRIREAKPLQGAEVVRVSELGAELLKEFPILMLALLPEVLCQVLAQVLCDTIVVEERVVDVEQEDDV